MDKQLWSQVEALFDQAVQLSPVERVAFIENATRDHPELKREIDSLLKHHVPETASSQFEPGPAMRDAIQSIVEQFETDRSMAFPGETLRPEGLGGEDEAAVNLALTLEAKNPDFAVSNVINRGGMGTVFRVFEKTLQRDIAVKVLHSSRVDQLATARFIRESKLAAGVQSDYVVEIFAVQDDLELPYLAMELVDGPSIREIIESVGPLQPVDAARFARQIAMGLQACHDALLIHRDVKPANIMIENRPVDAAADSANAGRRAKLIDFGIAKDLEDSEATIEQVGAGTPAYMSPEQVLNPKQVDQRCDVYGLGATLYQMLVGEPPFRGSTHMILKKIGNSDPAPPRSLDDRIPKDLESICLKALSAEPKHRYSTALTMAQDLQRFLDGRPTEARPITSFEKFRKWCGRNKRLAATSLAAAGFLIVLTISALTFSLILMSKDREIALQKQQNIEARVQAVVDSDPGALSASIDSILPLEPQTRDALQAQFESKQNRLNRRVNAAVALSFDSPPAAEFVLERVDRLFTSPEVCKIVLAALRNHTDPIPLLQASLDQTNSVDGKAKRIIMLAQFGEWGEWQKATSPTANPEIRTAIVHGFADWHGDISGLVDTLKDGLTDKWLWTVCQAIALIDQRSLNQDSVDDVVRFLQDVFQQTHHYGARASAEAALKRWGVRLIDDADVVSKSNWKVLDNGIRLVPIEPGKMLLGRIDSSSRFQGFPPHEVEITKPFYIADTETTVEQYREFLMANGDSIESKESLANQWDLNPNISPSNDHPAQMVTWIEAARFCNWLSKRHGLTPAYRQSDQRLKLQLSDGDVEVANWTLDPTSMGFRLPTEAEWEFACRCYSETPYHFGSDAELFKYYGLASQFTTLAAGRVRSTLPNANGLFDMHGNVWEWCHDWYSEISRDSLTDPLGPLEPSTEYGAPGRIYRGGGVGTFSGRIDSESRGRDSPDSKYDNLGFRVVLPVVR